MNVLTVNMQLSGKGPSKGHFPSVLTFQQAVHLISKFLHPSFLNLAHSRQPLRIPMSCEGPITFSELIDGLLELFSKENKSVVIEEVQAFFNRYVFNVADVAKYTKWDKFKYKRNLIH